MTDPNFPEATEEQIKEGKSLAWLSYFGILFLIPLLVYKDNPFPKYHARQGMVLFFAEIVFGIIWVILGAIVGAIAYASYSATGFGAGAICGTILWIVMAILWIGIAVLAIIGIIQSAQGKFWKMPVIGAIAESWFKGMV
ncbi:MAG: hypothetical protein U9Q76_05765 [candidate division WOR-3 bacterium]|nr:hypothetical protein [candidate division WOR-3 bacterium]